jgi:hypothetical protein
LSRINNVKESATRLEVSVLAERETITADLESHAKAGIEKAQAQSDEKTLAI